jgi:hypothetical protein
MSRTLAITVNGLAVQAGRDCEGENPRPIDYLVASFFLLDGFAIDDVIGLSVLTRPGPTLR